MEPQPMNTKLSQPQFVVDGVVDEAELLAMRLNAEASTLLTQYRQAKHNLENAQAEEAHEIETAFGWKNQGRPAEVWRVTLARRAKAEAAAAVAEYERRLLAIRQKLVCAELALAHRKPRVRRVSIRRTPTRGNRNTRARRVVRTVAKPAGKATADPDPEPDSRRALRSSAGGVA